MNEGVSVMGLDEFKAKNEIQKLLASKIKAETPLKSLKLMSMLNKVSFAYQLIVIHILVLTWWMGKVSNEDNYLSYKVFLTGVFISLIVLAITTRTAIVLQFNKWLVTKYEQAESICNDELSVSSTDKRLERLGKVSFIYKVTVLLGCVLSAFTVMISIKDWSLDLAGKAHWFNNIDLPCVSLFVVVAALLNFIYVIRLRFSDDKFVTYHPDRVYMKDTQIDFTLFNSIKEMDIKNG